MMASVVIHLVPDSDASAIIEQIQAGPGVEVGDFQPATHRLPAVIEARDSGQVEERTRWLQSLDEVAFVDVVFVHFDVDPDATSLTR